MRAPKGGLTEVGSSSGNGVPVKPAARTRIATDGANSRVVLRDRSASIWRQRTPTVRIGAIVKLKFRAQGGFGWQPEKWAEDDRILESFAFVNCCDLDRVVVTLQTKLKAIFRDPLTLSLLAQPGTDCIRREALSAFRFVEEFCEMQEVRQAPLACRQVDEARPNLLGNEEIPEHRGEATVDPLLSPAREEVEPILPFLVVPVEGEEFRRVEAKQGCGECTLKQSVAPWVDHALEELLQFARFVRGKNVSVALHDASNSSFA